MLTGAMMLSILNEKSNYVMVRWNQECLGKGFSKGDPEITGEAISI
jgi:hypothetical protein